MTADGAATTRAAAARARPRSAASLILVRRDGDGVRVLLGRRPPRDRFMPDIWVFPGGRVDPGDAVHAADSELRPEVARALERNAPGRLARGLAVAALRETWEETGLALGAVRDGRLEPDLAAVEYVARAITPSQNPIRYHARFFVASAERARGALSDSDELRDLAWLSLAEARERASVDVTQQVLREVESRVGGRAPGGIPLIHYRHGRMLIARR